MTPRNKKPFLLAIPLVLLASGLAIAFFPGMKLPTTQPGKEYIPIETTTATVNLTNGPAKIEALTLKNEYFLNWDLEEPREVVTITKIDSLQYRVEVSASGYFETVKLAVYTPDMATRYTISLTWDETAQSISLDQTNITF